MNKFIITALLFGAFVNSSYAGGQVNFEYEHEKSKTGVYNDALTVSPGYNLTGSFIDRVELQLEGNQNEGTTHATQTKVGVRVRKNFDIGAGFNAFTRVYVGRAMSADENFSFAYWEPGVKYTFNPTLSLTTSYRAIRTIDNSRSYDVNKLRIGPNFQLTKSDDVEIRYVKAWNSDSHSFINLANGTENSTAVVLEYTHKF
jgi:hypothetical protein